MRALALDDRVVVLLGAVPALVAVHAPVAPADACRSGRRSRRSQPSTVSTYPAPECGSVSRPSVNAWTTALSPAISISAFRWSIDACTPPSETRPIRCTRSASMAASRTSLSANDPSSIASSMRVRSCRTTAPAPRFRWPTSELPICPSGRPTARPLAVSSVCGCSAQSSSNVGVSACEIALPGPSGASPQPSRMTSATAGTGIGPGPSFIARRRRSRRSRRDRGSRRRRAPPSMSGCAEQLARRCRASCCRRRARARARRRPRSGRRPARG